MSEKKVLKHRLLIKQCSIAYDGKSVIKDCNFELESGHIAIILGKNGSGKTTLAHTVCGILTPDSGEIQITGYYEDGIESVLTSTKDQNKIKNHTPYPSNLTGIMLQNPSDSILATSVERELAFPLEYLAVPRPKMIEMVKSQSEKFGLSEYLETIPEELSGGMKARLAFCSAGIKNPPFMILDEPTNYLDYEGKKAILADIMRLKREGSGVILITQNESLSTIADEIYILDNGALTKTDKNDVLNNYGQNSIHDQEYGFEEIPDGQKYDKNPVISLRGVDFSYSEQELFSDFSLEIYESESIALVGASSAGKSTLLCLLAGLFECDKGQIDIKKRCGMIFQFPEFQLFDETVLSDVAFGPVNLKMDDPKQRAIEALKAMEIPEELWSRPPFTLSGGEKRRVGIAGTIAIKPEILLLDEPSGTLDRSGRHLLLDIIRQNLKSGKTVIAATHDIDFALSFARRVIALKKGKIIYDGLPQRLFSDRQLMESLGIGTETMLYESVETK